jgi:hypothetical protein
MKNLNVSKLRDNPWEKYDPVSLKIGQNRTQ